MMGTKLNTKRILIFVAFAFGIPWTAAVVLRLTIGVDDLSKAGFLLNWIFTLWSPALANVATRLITKEGWGHLMLRPNFRHGWRFYLAAWLLPFLATIVGAAVYYLLFPQFFDPNFSEVRKLFASSPALATWTAAADSWTVLLALTLMMMLIYVPIFTIVSFGEEFGWRAYLLPKLVEHFAGASVDDPTHTSRRYAAAARKAALLVGVIWGMWHLPGQFLFTPGTSILSALLYVVSTCCLSVLLSWVTLRSGSVWPAAVGHSGFNQGLALPMYSAKGPANLLLGPYPSGLIGGIGYLALALVLLFSRGAFAETKEAGAEKEPAVMEAQEVEPSA